MNDDQRHVYGIVLVTNRIESDGIDPCDIRRLKLSNGVPQQKTFASHRESLNFGGVRIKDRVGKVECTQVDPDNHHRCDASVGVSAICIGIYATVLFSLS